MTVEYHINERDELITLTASGSVTSSDACACIDEMLNDPAFDDRFPQLIDLRELEPVGSQENLQHFEEFLLGDYRSKLRAGVAIVVNSQWDEKVCAKAFWFSCMLDRAEMFDGWSQACKWLIEREFNTDVLAAAGVEPLASDDQDTSEHAQAEPEAKRVAVSVTPPD